MTPPPPVSPRTTGSTGRSARHQHAPHRRLLATTLAATTLAAGMSACTGHADQTATPDTQDLMATAAAQQATADAEATASQNAALGPDLAAKRDQARSATPPVPGDQINDNTREGATLAIYHFLQLYRYAFMTGNTDDINTNSDTECVFCHSTINDAKKLHDEGGWADYWDITLTKTTNYHDPTDTFPYARMDAIVTTSESSTYSGDGTKTVAPATTDRPFYFALYHDGTRWIIRGVAVQ